MMNDASLVAREDLGPRRRLYLSILIAVGTGLATHQLSRALVVDGLSPAETVIVPCFALTFAWISAACWTAVAGFVAERRGGTTTALSGLAPPRCDLPETARTALLVPICHENPEQVGARIRAMHRSLVGTGHAARFEWFILSDSSNQAVIRAERKLWQKLSREFGADQAVFYRNRSDNHGRKAGNIAEFCRRWGRRYRYFVVLDADSLMSGATLVHLVGTMEANPDAGLVQTSPRLIGGTTPFARALQFAGALYGPLMAYGLAYWFPGESNYWGHNAIIRTEAFMGSAGLPTLPGRPPLGGEILSHDFVEAALLSRAGWSVWLVPGLGGSYEEVPPTLSDYVRRDHRWCQGNLQHVGILMAKRLRPVSRSHLATGAMSYLASPLVILLVLASTLEAALSADSEPPAGGIESLAGLSAGAHDLVGLLIATVAMLILPRTLALIRAIGHREVRDSFGGSARLLPNMLAEWLFSMLLAPILIVQHAHAVLSILSGRPVSWGVQRRSALGLSWREAGRGFGPVTLFGCAWALLVWLAAPELWLWLIPFLPGLILAVPIASLSSRCDLGQWALRRGWFLIPEEIGPPAEPVSRDRPNPAPKRAATRAHTVAQIPASVAHQDQS